MLHIVYCIHGTFNSGGMERILANKANYLCRKGYNITIITTDQQGRKDFFPLSSSIQRFDLKINYTATKRRNIFSTIIRHLWKTHVHKKRLSQVLKKLKADVVISMFCNEVNFLYQIRDGSVKIAEIHFAKYFRQKYGRSGFWKLADLYRDRKESRLINRYHRFIVLTEQDRLRWGGSSNICTIHNACTFHPQKLASLMEKTVLAVGRFSHQKGFDFLIQAWNIVAFHHPDWKLRIVGDGELKEQLKGLISKLKLDQQIELIAPTKNIETEYLNGSIFVMSSRYEGLPMVLLEAASCGLPLISFDCPCGPAEVIQSEWNGLLVDPEQIELLAKAINRLIENPTLRLEMGKHALETAAKFSEELIMAQWMNLFDEIRPH